MIISEKVIFTIFCILISGLIGLSASELASNVSRKGWRRKLMDWYSSFGLLIFWAAGFRITVKGQQASRADAPILVGAPHSSFLEALIIYMCGSSPVSRHENRTAFLISACQLFYQAIFVDRWVLKSNVLYYIQLVVCFMLNGHLEKANSANLRTRLAKNMTCYNCCNLDNGKNWILWSKKNATVFLHQQKKSF